MSKLQNSQINNAFTFNMYLRQCIALAENVFKFENIPDMIDMKYVNEQLLYKGRIAWFYDEELESLLALPFTTIGKNDLYNRPRAIHVYGKNGYYNDLKNRDDFVIMYDNYGMYSLYLDIKQYATRLRNYYKGNRYKLRTAKNTKNLANISRYGNNFKRFIK